MYVGNAKQAAHYYKTAFGFKDLAFSGLETGQKDRVSYVLQQGKIRLVLTAPLSPESEIWPHIQTHGDGVKVIALWVEDAVKSFNETVERGAAPYFEPRVEKDAHGEVVRAGIRTYGDTVHVFVERKITKVSFCPAINPTIPALFPKIPACFTSIIWWVM